MELELYEGLIGIIFSAGGGGVVAFALFKRMSGAWLDAKFATKN